MNVPRPVIASLLAPVAGLLPILVLAVYELHAPVLIINGEVDDAPQRLIGLLLIGLPFIYVLFAIIAFSIGKALVKFGFRSLRHFIFATTSLSLLMAIPCGILGSDYKGNGIQDAFISIFAFAALFLVVSLPSAACWWYLAKLPPNPS